MSHSVVFFRIERDFKYFGYKLCDIVILQTQNRTQSQKWIREVKLIKQQCYDNYYDNCEDLSIESYQFSSGYTADNTTIVNISHKYTINLNYQEQLIMDVNDLFYNLGGIVRMWIGWSVASINSLTNFLVKNLHKLIRKPR